MLFTLHFHQYPSKKYVIRRVIIVKKHTKAVFEEGYLNQLPFKNNLFQ
jgi:hypothetical protein